MLEFQKTQSVIVPFSNNNQMAQALHSKGVLLKYVTQECYVTVMYVNSPFIGIVDEKGKIADMNVINAVDVLEFMDGTPFGVTEVSYVRDESVSIAELELGKRYHVTTGEPETHYLTVYFSPEQNRVLKIDRSGAISNSALMLSPKLLSAKFWEIITEKK